MSFKPKLWLGVGAFALTGAVNPAAADSSLPPDPAISRAPVAAGARNGPASERVIPVQARGPGGESGETGQGGERRPRSSRQAGESRERSLQRKKRRTGRVIRHKQGPGGESGERGGAARSSLQGGEGGERGAPGIVGQGGESGEAGISTQYIFGFTEGADTERAGEREIENDLVGRFGKRGGRYTALQNKTELEHGVTDNLTFELGTFTSYYRIRNVPDLDNRNAADFDGLFAELKYRLLDRAIHPVGLAVSIEPEWHRFSETGGNREDSYALELKLYADKELVPNTLFAAANLVYEPEAAHVRERDPETGRFTEWERESGLSASGAISTALTNRLFVGAELRYLAKFEGSFLNRFEGGALYAGPTLSARILPKAILQGAYSVQIAGKAADEPERRLDLVNFERHQARLRLVFEF